MTGESTTRPPTPLLAGMMDEEAFMTLCIGAMQSEDPAQRIGGRLIRDTLPLIKRELKNEPAIEVVTAAPAVIAAQLLTLVISVARPGAEQQVGLALLDAARDLLKDGVARHQRYLQCSQAGTEIVAAG